MTTIAANREYMVSDSRVSIAEKGFSYPAIKIMRVGKMIVGASGDGGDCSRLLEWAKEGFKPKDEPKWSSPPYSEDEIVGLILKEDGLYIWTHGGPAPEKLEAEYFAVGSGGKAARVAMLLGKTPEEAVEIACQVDDIYSGLPTQILRL